MLQSLKDTYSEPFGTKSAIRQALKSFTGLRNIWVVVESEDDVLVYEKFMCKDTVMVKTSADNTGRKGCANVENIVREVGEEEPRAHIIGIRDADYVRFKEGYTPPPNIFLTDRRDLEMMLLEPPSVQQSLFSWAPSFKEALERCCPVCRHFGYLRIFNFMNDLSVRFHGNLNIVQYWDCNCHDFVEGWQEKSTEKFLSLANMERDVDVVHKFVTTHSLDKQSFYDICRGHDLLPLLSRALIQEHIYSKDNIMIKMIESYGLEDFKLTRLYTSIQNWQNTESVVALLP